MNSVSRTFAKLLSSSSTRKRVLLPLHSNVHKYSSPSSSSSLGYFTASAGTQKDTSKPRKSFQGSSLSSLESLVEPISEDGSSERGLLSGDWPRPSEIPWQAKVCNSVNLIGKVKVPVQFQESADGKCWAVTTITQETTAASHSPPFWIPVIFEGDLAHIAACHLKKDDCVYIGGQLSADPPPFDRNQGPTSFQVMAHSINFVKRSLEKKGYLLQNKEKRTSAGKMGGGDSGLSLWRDLVMNPKQWWDNRQDKLNGKINPRSPDFKRKDDNLSLWLDAAPEWVLSKLEGLEFDVRTHKTKHAKGDGSWKDLVENPGKWWDNRTSKIKERAPDFRHKDTGEGLWLSDSPDWVIAKLPPIKTSKVDTFKKRDTLLS